MESPKSISEIEKPITDKQPFADDTIEKSRNGDNVSNIDKNPAVCPFNP